MKFGICLNMNAAGPDGTGIEAVEKMAAAGFDYVELPLAEMSALSDEAFKRLESRVKAAGIPCETCNNFFPKTMRLTGAAADHAGALSYARAALDRAARLGARVVVFGSGGAKNVPEGFPLEEGFRQVAALLRELAPLVKERGIAIAIEPLRRAECNLINSFYEGCRLAEAVGDPAVRVLVDYYHFMTEAEPVSHLLDEGAEYLRHTHFARVNGRAFPRDAAEDAAYRPFFDALRAVGYDARMSLEAYSPDPEAEAPMALNFFRQNL
ncbi:MAG: sugar phosphate isomerase/epimerase [Clostridiales bacterium]|jgi:D-psicose/D-tagatose/L-ribulose 3-epimerase|nr:sugar phosphate isomerase/epimerase [Clostridiales bacterium]